MSTAPAPVDVFTRRILDLLFVANALACYFPRFFLELPSRQFVLTITVALLVATVIWIELRRNFSVWLLVGFVVVTFVLAWSGGMGLVPVAVVTIFVRYGLRSGVVSAVILWAGLETLRITVTLLGGVSPRELALAMTRGLLETMVPVILGVGLLRRQEVVTELARTNQQLSWTHRELAAQTELRQELMIATERARSARVLHEGLGVHLAGAASAIDRLERPGADRAAELGNARTLLADALREMRTWVRVMNPANRAESCGLSGLPALATSFRGTGLAVHVDLPEVLPTLGQTQSLFVTRFVQEGIASAIEQGGAANLWISVTSRPRRLEIELTDDGARAGHLPNGFGFDSLRERAEALGGSLGCRVRAGTRSGRVLYTWISTVEPR